MNITGDKMNDLPFQSYRKIALLRARALTDSDYQLRNGIIHTREGSAGFEPGDYIALGNESEEWPITKEHFLPSYEQVSEPNSEGFAYYRAKDICLAYQMSGPFTVKRTRGDLLKGKAGDYLVLSGDHMWIVDRTLFEKDYEPLQRS